MSIVGFGFTKIKAEKIMGAKGQININNNISIKNIEKTNIGLMTGKGAAKIDFKFITKYSPEVGVIELEGNAVVMLPEAELADIIKTWKDKKNLPSNQASSIINYVLEKCNIQTLILARDINLPSPIRLPRVNINNASEVITKKPAKENKKAPAKKAEKKTSKKKK